MTQVQLLRLLIARTHEQTFALKPAISQLLRNFLYDKEKLYWYYLKRDTKREVLGGNNNNLSFRFNILLSNTWTIH